MEIVKNLTYSVEMSQRMLNLVVTLLETGPDNDDEINGFYDALAEHATESFPIETNQDPQVVGPLWELE